MGKFSLKRLAYERSLGKIPPKGRPRWQASVSGLAMMSLACRLARLPSSWAKSKHFFEHIHRLTVSESMLYAGSLGKYLLQFAELKPFYRNIYVSLLDCLEGLQCKLHTKESVEQLRVNLTAVLCLCEIHFPASWMTIVRHILPHLCDFILRCGPFKAHNMLIYERWHVIFKSLCRGQKNILASFENHYALLLATAEWRDATWAQKGYQSHMHKEVVDYSNVKHEFKGKRNTMSLGLALFVEVRNIWIRKNTTYAALTAEYRRRPGSNGHYLPVGWEPEREMNSLEKKVLSMTAKCLSSHTVVLNGNRFTTSEYLDRRYAHDDAAISVWQLNEANELVCRYGRGISLFEHELYSGGPSISVAECEWLETLPELTCTGLPTVLKNPDLPVNATGRLVELPLCVPHNVALLSMHPKDAGCTVFAVVDRARRFGSCWEGDPVNLEQGVHEEEEKDDNENDGQVEANEANGGVLDSDEEDEEDMLHNDDLPLYFSDCVGSEDEEKQDEEQEDEEQEDEKEEEVVDLEVEKDAGISAEGLDDTPAEGTKLTWRKGDIVYVWDEDEEEQEKRRATNAKDAHDKLWNVFTAKVGAKVRGLKRYKIDFGKGEMYDYELDRMFTSCITATKNLDTFLNN